MNDAHGCVATLTSEIKRLSRELKRQSSHEREILDSLPILVYRVNKEGRVVSANCAIADAVGQDTKEILGRLGGEIFKCLHAFVGNGCGRGEPCQECVVRNSISHTFETGNPVYMQEGKIASQFGDRYYLISTSLMAGDEGHETVISLVDITDGKLAEQAILDGCMQVEEAVGHQNRCLSLSSRITEVCLQSRPDELSYHLLEVILDTIKSPFGYLGHITDNGDLDCCALVDHDPNRFVIPQEQWKDCFGSSFEERETVLVNNFFTLPQLEIEFDSLLAVPLICRDELVGQLCVADKSGGYDGFDQELLESAAAQTAPLVEALSAQEKQAKEHARLEEQYRQSQKLGVIGRFAGGVAHDFNNLLMAILNSAECVLIEMEDDNPKKEDIEDILAASEQASVLTRQLLAFCRKQALKPTVLCINRVVRRIENLLGRLLGRGINLKTELADDLGMVRMSPGQLEQILMNLAINARDAMHGGGELTILTENVTVKEIYKISDTQLNPGAYIAMAVRDTGDGMDDEVKEHIFEPFFTTKDHDHGTGLGLATVYGIVRQCLGKIEVLSQIGKGSEFRIYLPRLEEPVKK